MIRRILLLGLLLSPATCGTTQFDRDFGSSRDFVAYRGWSWSQSAFEYHPDGLRVKSDLTEQRIREAVAQQLDQRGLRPVQGNVRGDTTVRAYLIIDDRQDQTITNYGGGHRGGYWERYWGGLAMAEMRAVNYKVATLQVDLFDGKDGKLVWRGSGEQIMRTSSPNPAEHEQAIRETVQKVMSQYPSR